MYCASVNKHQEEINDRQVRLLRRVQGEPVTQKYKHLIYSNCGIQMWMQNNSQVAGKKVRAFSSPDYINWEDTCSFIQYLFIEHLLYTMHFADSTRDHSLGEEDKHRMNK